MVDAAEMLYAVGRGVVWVVREHVEHPAAGDRFAPHKRGPPIGVTGVHDRESRGHTTYSSGVVRQRAWTSTAPPCADRGNARVRLRDRGAARRAAGPPWNPVLLLLTSASSSPPHTGVCSPLACLVWDGPRQVVLQEWEMASKKLRTRYRIVGHRVRFWLRLPQSRAVPTPVGWCGRGF